MNSVSYHLHFEQMGLHQIEVKMKILAYFRAMKALVVLFLMKYLGRLDNLKFTYRNHFGKNVSLNFDKNANVFLGKDIGLRDNVCLSCRNGGRLFLGDNVFLNNGCQIIVHDEIFIEKNVKVGQYTCFFDHDYDFRAPNGLLGKKFKTTPIIVGEGTWIGSGCIILRGSKIGKKCVIGAGCVIKGVIEDGSVVVEKRVRNKYLVKKQGEKHNEY